MTIHRVGPVEEEPSPIRSSLGHILVTIDDLDGLMQLLRQRDCPPESPTCDVKVEFAGGYFTAADDLARLSDIEIRDLRVVTTETQVILSTTDALAIGTEEATEAIYRQWARPRRRNKRSLSVEPFRYALLLLIALAIFFVISRPEGFRKFLTDLQFNTSIGILLGLGAAVLILAFFSDRIAGAPIDSALIVPFSLEEYRRTRAGNFYPRWSLVTTIVSVLAAIAAIIVAIAIAK